METETKAPSQNRPALHRRFQDTLWEQPAQTEHELRQLVDLIIEAALEKGKAEEISTRGSMQGGAR